MEEKEKQWKEIERLIALNKEERAMLVIISQDQSVFAIQSIELKTFHFLSKLSIFQRQRGKQM